MPNALSLTLAATGVGLLVAIGVVLYELFSENKQQEQQYRNPQSNNAFSPGYDTPLPRNRNNRTEICVICCDGADLHKLNCGHAFHLECIRKWLERSRQCPVCREDIRYNL